MKQLIHTCKTYIHKREFYYRILMPYMALTILSVIVTGLLGLWIIGSSYNKKIIDADRKTLQNIQTYTDETLYNSLLTIIRDNFLMTQAVSSGSFSLNTFFTQESTTILEDSRYLSYLQNLQAKNPLIQSITLYQKSQNFAISTAYGVSHHPDTSSGFQAQIPFHAYKDLADTSKKSVFTSLSFEERAFSDTLLLLRSIPLYSTLSDGQGFIAISIDPAVFLEQIKARYPITGGLMIYGQEQELLLSILPDDCSDSAAFLDDIGHAVAEGSSSTRSGQVKYSLSIHTSADSGWTYVSAVPWDQFNQERMATFQITGICILATVLLSLFLVHRITFRIYHPLNTLRMKVARESEDPNDLTAIQNALVYLENQVDDMKQTLDQNKEILLYKIMMDLLYSRQLDEEDIKKRLALCQKPFDLPCYCVLILAFDPIVFDSIALEQREYIAVKTKEILEQHLAQSMIHMTQSRPENLLITIMNLHELQYHAFLEQQQKLLTGIMEQIPVRVNLAFSPLLTSLSQIGQTFPTVSDYLKYGFLYGSGNVFSPDLYTAFESTSFSLTPKEYGEIETRIRTGQVETVIRYLRQLEETILTQKPSHASVNSFLIQLYGIAFRVGNERAIFSDKEKKQEALASFQSASTFRQSMDSIFHILSLYQEAYENKAQSHDAKLAASVIEYIRANWQEELTLTSLADRFSVSSSHLSRLFKQVTGDNLSVFVIQFKLEKAAELLLAHPDRSVKEIGETLGYYSSAYFTKLFKDHYGVTPSQYRKQHLL